MKLKRCRTCGDELPPTVEYFYRKGKGIMPDCIPCVQAERKLRWKEEADESNERRRQQYHEAHEYKPGFVVTVINDPEPIGGFRRGATIPSQQFKMGLEMGCFASGMIVRMRTKTFRVAGKKIVEMQL